MSSWKKNLYIMWACQFIAMMGMSAVVPFLPLFIRSLGVTEIKATAQWSGYVFAGPFFLSFFLAPVWGTLGDKYGRKIMTIRAIIGLAVSQIIVGFSQDVTQLLIGRLLQGALSGFIPASMALIAANTPEEKTGYALGVLQSATAGGNVLGPVVGGVLSDLFGFRFVFFAVSGLLTLSGIAVMLFVKEDIKKTSKEYFSFMDNWKYIFSNKILLYASLMITTIALGFSFIRPIFVLFVESFNVDKNILPTLTGILFSIMGIFSTISSAWWGKRVEYSGVKRNLIIASSLTATMYLLQIFITNVYYLIPIMMVVGFSFGALLPLLFTFISRNVVVERRGGVLGVASSFQILGNFFGPIAGGYIFSALHFTGAFILTAILFFITTLFAYSKLK